MWFGRCMHLWGRQPRAALCAELGTLVCVAVRRNPLIPCTVGHAVRWPCESELAVAPGLLLISCVHAPLLFLLSWLQHRAVGVAFAFKNTITFAHCAKRGLCHWYSCIFSHTRGCLCVDLGLQSENHLPLRAGGGACCSHPSFVFFLHTFYGSLRQGNNKLGHQKKHGPSVL